MTASSIYIGLLTFSSFIYINVFRSWAGMGYLPQMYASHQVKKIRTETHSQRRDLFVVVLFIGDLIRFYVFLTPRTDPLGVLKVFSIGNISSIIWTAIAALYLAYILSIGRFRIGSLFRTPYFSIFVLVLVYLLSSAWSVVPMFSLYRGLELVVWVSLSVYLFTCLHSLVQKVLFLAIYCLTWFCMLFPLFIDALLHGIIFSAIKDNLLPTVGFSVAVLGWKTPLRLLFCVVGLTTIVLAGSASSIACGAVACSVGMIFNRNIMVKALGFACVVASVLFIVVYLIAPDQFPETIDFLSNILQKPKEELLGATGRFAIWSVLWEASKDNYFGTGFGSDRFIQLIQRLDVLSDRFGKADIVIMSAHNSVLGAWLSAGWLGVVALFFVSLNGIRDSLKGDKDRRATTTMVLVFIIFNDFTIPGLGENYSCIWLVWIAVLSIVDRMGLTEVDPRGTISNRRRATSSVPNKISLMSSAASLSGT